MHLNSTQLSISRLYSSSFKLFIDMSMDVIGVSEHISGFAFVLQLRRSDYLGLFDFLSRQMSGYGFVMKQSQVARSQSEPLILKIITRASVARCYFGVCAFMYFSNVLVH